jgi:hypothetical protein
MSLSTLNYERAKAVHDKGRQGREGRREGLKEVRKESRDHA